MEKKLKGIKKNPNEITLFRLLVIDVLIKGGFSVAVGAFSIPLGIHIYRHLIKHHVPVESKVSVTNFDTKSWNKGMKLFIQWIIETSVKCCLICFYL